MDLFTPVKDQNDYGARNKKNVSKKVLARLPSMCETKLGVIVSRSSRQERLDQARMFRLDWLLPNTKPFVIEMRRRRPQTTSVTLRRLESSKIILSFTSSEEQTRLRLGRSHPLMVTEWPRQSMTLTPTRQERSMMDPNKVLSTGDGGGLDFRKIDSKDGNSTTMNWLATIV